MARALLIIQLTLFSHTLVAQKEAIHWVFGGFGGIDFSCSTPQLAFSAFDGLEGGTAISSQTGELLFYTNGDVVWNKNHFIMPNGKGLGGLCTLYDGYSSSSQSSIIIPYPGSPNLYYIFTTDCAEDSYVDGLRYSIVDISLQGGLGDVVLKNQLLKAYTAEKIAAVFQSNGKDIWVVTHGSSDDIFYAYSITASGLNTTPVISTTGQKHPGGRGYLKFSPNGKRLLVNAFATDSRDGIPPELFLFNNSTGQITSEFIFPNTPTTYAASFSPNSKLLYITCSWICNSVVTQYNLEAGTPEQIVLTSYTTEAANIYGALQLGPDGKLYCLTYNIDFAAHIFNSDVSVFNEPDKIGAQCGYHREFIKLPCSINNSWGLPNFIESYFQTPIVPSLTCNPPDTISIRKADFVPIVNCVTKSVELVNSSDVRKFEIGYLRNLYSCAWDFGDGGQIISDLKNQAHTYVEAGIYTIRLSVSGFDFNCRKHTVEKTVQITEFKTDFSNDSNCMDYKVNFFNKTTVNIGDTITWHWDFGDNKKSSDSSVVNPSYLYGEPGNYLVTLTATNKCGTSFFKRIVTVHEYSYFSLGADTTICLGDRFLLNPDIHASSYLWNDGSTDKTLEVAKNGTYWLKLTRDDCVITDTIIIDTKDCDACNFNVPNVFTPNDDGYNQSFIFSADCDLIEFNMEIFDRWGKVIYAGTSTHWDGKVGSKEIPDGIYYYYIKYSYISLRNRELTRYAKGWVHIVR